MNIGLDASINFNKLRFNALFSFTCPSALADMKLTWPACGIIDRGGGTKVKYRNATKELIEPNA